MILVRVNLNLIGNLVSVILNEVVGSNILILNGY